MIEQGVATDVEVAAFWPGGSENPDTTFDGWVECYAQCTRLVGRLETQSTDTDAMRNALATAVRRAASRATLTVELSIGARVVSPKSAWALWWLESLDATAQSVAMVADQLSQVAEGEALLGLPSLTQGLAWRTWAWILLSPGVGLPFESLDELDPPAWTSQLLPEDFLAIYKAHRTLHFEDTATMAAAFPSSNREKSRLYLGGFLSSHANEVGVAPSDIVRGWSLPEAFASAVSVAEAHRVSTANAKPASGA